MGLNKIGILAMVLLLALGAMGTVYGAWVDEIYIEGYLSTGDINTSLSCGTHSDEVTCSVSTNKLTITLSNAPLGDYYCYFKVNNAVNSFPIEVTSMNITNPYSGVTAVFDDLTGMVINPGGTSTGKVTIPLLNNDHAAEVLTFVLTVNVE